MVKKKFPLVGEVQKESKNQIFVDCFNDFKAAGKWMEAICETVHDLEKKKRVHLPSAQFPSQHWDQYKLSMFPQTKEWVSFFICNMAWATSWEENSKYHRDI